MTTLAKPTKWSCEVEDVDFQELQSRDKVQWLLERLSAFFTVESAQSVINNNGFNKKIVRLSRRSCECWWKIQ